MQVIRDVASCPSPANGSAVTIGAYDGVHVGHRTVIGEVRRLAAARNLSTAVVTFDQHPARVVRPESAPKLLTDLDQKLSLLAGTDVDYCYVVRFDAQQATEPAEEFVRRVLVGCLNARMVVVGADFHFGHRRGGDVALLQSVGNRYGFTVEGLELAAQGRGSTTISSTAIRRALAAGELAAANAMLGRAHEVRGIVGRGDRRGGSELGFPTANVAVPPEIQLPAVGIYAGWYVRPDGATWPAAISLGWRPTFDRSTDRPLLEAHVLDFEGDLYGEAAAVRFVARLRDEERFETLDALVAQIGQDVVASRDLLASTGEKPDLRAGLLP